MRRLISGTPGVPTGPEPMRDSYAPPLEGSKQPVAAVQSGATALAQTVYRIAVPTAEGNLVVDVNVTDVIKQEIRARIKRLLDS